MPLYPGFFAFALREFPDMDWLVFWLGEAAQLLQRPEDVVGVVGVLMGRLRAMGAELRGLGGGPETRRETQPEARREARPEARLRARMARTARRKMRRCCSRLAALIYSLQTPEMFDYLDALGEIAFSAALGPVPVCLCAAAYGPDVCVQGKDYPPFLTQLR